MAEIGIPLLLILFVYDMVESVYKQIEQRKETISDETNKDEMNINFKLLRTYFKLTSKVLLC